MITYKIEMIEEALKEICKKFTLTKNLQIKKIKLEKEDLQYRITLLDDSQHTVKQELLNQYIETFGDKGGLEIAGCLMHSIEQEESAFSSGDSDSDETWDGDIQDAIDYVNKQKKEDGTEDDVDYQEGKDGEDKYF